MFYHLGLELVSLLFCHPFLHWEFSAVGYRPHSCLVLLGRSACLPDYRYHSGYRVLFYRNLPPGHHLPAYLEFCIHLPHRLPAWYRCRAIYWGWWRCVDTLPLPAVGWGTGAGLPACRSAVTCHLPYHLQGYWSPATGAITCTELHRTRYLTCMRLPRLRYRLRRLGGVPPPVTCAVRTVWGLRAPATACRLQYHLLPPHLGAGRPASTIFLLVPAWCLPLGTGILQLGWKCLRCFTCHLHWNSAPLPATSWFCLPAILTCHACHSGIFHRCHLRRLFLPAPAWITWVPGYLEHLLVLLGLLGRGNLVPPLCLDAMEFCFSMRLPDLLLHHLEVPTCLPFLQDLLNFHLPAACHLFTAVGCRCLGGAPFLLPATGTIPAWVV